MEIDDKIFSNFKGIIVRKNLASTFPSVPRFVSEFLIMGLIKEDKSISEGDLLNINKFITENRPDPKDYEVWKDKFSNSQENNLLDIFNVQIDLSYMPPLRKCIVPYLKEESPIRIKDDIVEQYEGLLREGMWGVGKINQISEKKAPFKSNLILNEFVPFELPHFSINQFLNGTNNLTLGEWINLLINTIGLNPDFYPDFEQKILLLCRLIPIVEFNTNLIELGPKETGKSYLMENISPNVYNIQPPDVTMASLFYNARTQEVGLLGLKDVIVFDEVCDVPLRQDSKMIPSKLRGFLSDGKYKRGDKEIFSRSSIFLMGNIKCDENLMPLDPKYLLSMKKEWHDSAMLDRFSGLIYGWELKKLTVEAISKSYGIAGDYFHKVLSYLRTQSFRIKLEKCVVIQNYGEPATTRNKKAVISITSGLLKLLFPNENYSKEDLEMILEIAIKLRTRLYNQIKYIDEEYRKSIDLNYIIRQN